MRENINSLKREIESETGGNSDSLDLERINRAVARETRDASQTQLIRESRIGWQKMVIFSLVLSLMVMSSLQKALKIPLYDVISEDEEYVQRNYSSSNVLLAKVLLLTMLIGAIVAVYSMFREANYDFAAFLAGGSYARRSSNQFSVQKAKSDRLLERQIKKSKGEYDSEYSSEQAGQSFDRPTHLTPRQPQSEDLFDE